MHDVCLLFLKPIFYLFYQFCKVIVPYLNQNFFILDQLTTLYHILMVTTSVNVLKIRVVNGTLNKYW